jgi:hypothetical protein
MQPANGGRARWAAIAILLGAPAGGWALPTAAAAPRSRPAAPDSGLAFRPLGGPTDRFSVSDLTRTYERDLTIWSNAGRQPVLDLAWLDRYGGSTGGHAAIDSSDIDVVGGAERREPTAMTPDERAAAEPPQPGVQVGIPSPVAVAGALLGGVAVLVKLIAALGR